MMKENEEKVKYLTQLEMKKVFKVIEKDNSIHALRNLTIFRVAYRCALRASELGLIRLEDYNKTRGEMYCHRLKGSNNNTIRLDQETIKILNKYIRQNEICDNQQVLFLSQEKKPISRKTLDVLMKKYCHLAKISDIEKYHFHTLKHTAAVHLAESEIDIKELQYYLGHKSVTNTLIYFQFTTKQQETMYAKLQKNNQMV